MTVSYTLFDVPLTGGAEPIGQVSHGDEVEISMRGQKRLKVAPAAP